MAVVVLVLVWWRLQPEGGGGGGGGQRAERPRFLLLLLLLLLFRPDLGGVVVVVVVVVVVSVGRGCRLLLPLRLLRRLLLGPALQLEELHALRHRGRRRGGARVCRRPLSLLWLL